MLPTIEKKIKVLKFSIITKVNLYTQEWLAYATKLKLTSEGTDTSVLYNTDNSTTKQAQWIRWSLKLLPF